MFIRSIGILKYSKFIHSIRILVKYSNSPSPSASKITNIVRNINQAVPETTNEIEATMPAPTTVETTTNNFETSASVAQTTLVCNILFVVLLLCSHSGSVLSVLYAIKWLIVLDCEMFNKLDAHIYMFSRLKRLLSSWKMREQLLKTEQSCPTSRQWLRSR